MLAISDLETFYGESQVLFGVSFDVAAGEVVTLLGRNGMGKTTTIRSIMGIVPPAKGRILFAGKPIHGLQSFRVARSGIGYVPEGRQIFPNLTVSENLIVAAANRDGRANPWTAAAVLDLFPALAPRLNTPGALLSGGEQQMLAIGRALLTNPRLLILDEAAEGLAPLMRAEIWRVIGRLKAAGQSILIIDKNVKVLSRLADRHYVLEKGRVVWSGTSAELRAHPELQTRYLGI